MAKYVVPPKSMPIVRCFACKTLYVPEKYNIFYEKCPTCGYASNSEFNHIPLWKYNLIKWFRGGFKK